jgi:hypothetical protein
MKYLLALSSVLILGCSSGTSQESGTLANQFEKYKSATTAADEQRFVKPELWETLVAARAGAERSEMTDAIAYFPNEIVVTTEVNEAITDEGGCLVVSGTNSKQTPMDYYVQFDLVGNDWVISDIAIKYFLDSSERFLTYAECDADKRMALWLESVQ